MKKLLPILLLACFSASAAKIDNIDVLVVNQQKMDLPLSKIESLIQRKVELGNRMFQEHDLKIHRKIQDIEYADHDVKFMNLIIETAVLGGATVLSDQAAFANHSLAKEVRAWLKKDSSHYKLIFIPQTEDTLECGMTTMFGDDSFSVIYLSETGMCSPDWIVTHELGHQDGLLHEDSQGKAPRGGKCGDEFSLMYSGAHGDRTGLFGSAEKCGAQSVSNIERGDEPKTPFDYYKARSDENRKRHYSLESEYIVPFQPIIISEMYKVDNMDVTGALVVYNPTMKPMSGRVRLVDQNAPITLDNQAYVLPSQIYAKPRAITTYPVKITRNELLGYGVRMNVVAEIEW
ncbi:hypothetical protein OTK49_01315 [Vibrio coralliirubri]|uniref:hypothetical protein n=1 Tax=Vibrio coralliirubri TaxID=1516159 RepID=UPI0022841EE2|nr:hypothetical protein [Vibrio coralliirubri]MCY9861168.1 hypothetical protein [Vibrio coralliirubri]